MNVSEEFNNIWAEIANIVTGQTITGVDAEPCASGLGGATDKVTITTGDGRIMVIEAGSYVIPEESCVHVSVWKAV